MTENIAKFKEKNAKLKLQVKQSQNNLIINDIALKLQENVKIIKKTK